VSSSRTDIENRVNRGLAWIAIASSIVWVLDIVGMIIVLALWISPAEMGIAALIIPFFPALDLAAELGLPSAVIQRDDHTPEKISTVFWLNLGMALLLCVVLGLVVGPILAAVHGHPILAAMAAVYGVKLVWHNVYVVPRSLMRRELRFKELSVIRIIGNVGEFAAKVGSAAAGAGIWCFLIGPSARVVLVGIGIQICHPWRPQLLFRLREAMDWAKFGLKASASQIIYQLYTNVDYQVVGYAFTPEVTGLYWLAYELVLKPCFLIGQTLAPIAFAAYSRLKHTREALVKQFISFTRLSLVVMLGFLSIIIVSADDILRLIWDEDAARAATAARILCGVGVLRSLSFVIPPMLDGLGRPGLGLIYNAVAAVLVPASFFASASLFGDELGYLSVPLAWVVVYPVAFSVLLFLALRLVKLPLTSYLRQVLAIPAATAVAIGAGWAARLAVDSQPPGLRFGVSVVAVLIVFGVLLAKWQGISPRSVARAIRGDDDAETNTDAVPSEPA